MKSVLDDPIYAKFISQNSNMFKIEHILHNSNVTIFPNGWGSCICHKSTYLSELPHL